MIVVITGKVNKNNDMIDTMVTVNTTDKPRIRQFMVFIHILRENMVLMESKKRLLILMEILLIIQIIKLKRLKHTILLH